MYARSSVDKLSASRSGDLMMIFFGLLSSVELFFAERRLDLSDVTDFADVMDFLLLLTALPGVDFLPDLLK